VTASVTALKDSFPLLTEALYSGSGISIKLCC
jgi:hypothetical protein